MSNWLDPGFYLNMKLKQLGTTAADLGIHNENDLAAFISNAGMTLEQHYLQAGRAEGLTPNVYFNESEYLACKLAQLQESPATAGDWAGKDINALRDVISGSGMSAAEHYDRFGAFETRADGTLLNPSNAFDANAYMQAKLYQLQAADPATYGGMSTAELVQTLHEAGFSPAAHADMYGRTEGAQSGMAMIQAVPDAQRVSADPGRDAYGLGVPSNPVEPGSGPNVTAPQTVANAFDISNTVPHPDSVVVPNPTPPAPLPPVYGPGDIPPGYAYNDLIVSSMVDGKLVLDLNEDSIMYHLVNNSIKSGLTNMGSSDNLQLDVYITPEYNFDLQSGPVWTPTHLEVRYTVPEYAELSPGWYSNVMNTQYLDVPLGTTIDLTRGLQGDGWTLSADVDSSYLFPAPSLVLETPGGNYRVEVTADLEYHTWAANPTWRASGSIVPLGDARSQMAENDAAAIQLLGVDNTDEGVVAA